MSNGERARFEVILESIETKIGVLADGDLALNEKFDRLQGKFDQLSDDVAVLHTDLSSVKLRVGKIEHHLGLNGVAQPRVTRPTAKKATRRKPRLCVATPCWPRPHNVAVSRN